MKQRDIWIRKKKEKGKPLDFVVEARARGKPIFLWTISKDLTKLLQHLIKTSYWTKEKAQKISNKLDSLDIKKDKIRIDPQKFAQEILSEPTEPTKNNNNNDVKEKQSTPNP